jgi:ParB family transcriptional regulator, chromosome partitioning protein
MLERFVKGIIEKEGKKAIQEIPVDSISVNPYQPRRNFSQKKLEDLAQSIREQGVIQPVIVRPLGSGYELVSGERRLRASKLIGNRNIPAIVRQLSDQDMIEIVFIENLQREQLDESEEDEAYKQLLGENGGNASSSIMRRVGKAPGSFGERLWMLNMPQIVKKAFSSKLISAEHAKLLSQVLNEDKQNELLERIYRENLSVDDAARIISSLPSSFKQKLPNGDGRGETDAIGTRYSRSTIKQIDGCLALVGDLVAAIRAAGVPISVSETLDGNQFKVSLAFPVKGS